MTSLGLPNLCVPQLQRHRSRLYPPCGVPSQKIQMATAMGGVFQTVMTRILSRKNTENCKMGKTIYFSR